MKWILSLLVMLTLLQVSPAMAGDTPLAFESEAERQRFNTLLEELRCLVCQNQSLADSNADLAEDLRLEVYDMFNSGKAEDEIVEYLVARYGEFVLYRPRLAPGTLLLWFGPILFLLVGIVIAVSVQRRSEDKDIDESQLKYAEELLEEEDKTPS